MWLTTSSLLTLSAWARRRTRTHVLNVTQPCSALSCIGSSALLLWLPVQRSVGATAMNEHSSRSHMVFMLYIDGVNEAAGQECHGQ